jgi:exonuclease VII small subunit
MTQQQIDVNNFEQQTQKMSTIIAELEREERNLKEQERY